MSLSLSGKLSRKEPKFFSTLKELSSIIFQASELMIECVSNYDSTLSNDIYRQIKALEKQGDTVSNAIFNELNKTFITPFDREDIHHLATLLDDVTDYLNNSAKRIVMYNPKSMPKSAVELAELIKEGAENIDKAVDVLCALKKDADKIKLYCKNLHDIENKADDVYEQFIINLFETEKDEIEVIKLKEIMQELEKATNAAEQVGKIIKSIVVKYS